MKGTPWKGHGVWHMERAALLPPALWHSLFFCQCACMCGRLLINTYVHISNIFASVCCQFAAAPLCAVNYFCCLQLPPSYWQIHKHFATICFPFSTYPPPCFYFFAIPAASSLHFMLIFGLGLGLRFLGFWVLLVSRFGNCKALSGVAFVNAKFCVCSAQIMQLICAQLQALCTHVSQPLLTFDSLLHF